MKVFRCVALALCCLAAHAQRVGAPTDELTKLSVDDLFSVEVTSVGRKAQQLSKAPAAVFVLTSEDIRRTGATSIPEALQWVPGLTVLRLDGRSWIVSARGSARLYADKILVMIDGRSLYTPLFSGVIWDAIDVAMEDIERIEVVRGPGAVMWGPNAVNGVINIITKKASRTAGGLVSVAAGNEQRGAAMVRWGATPSDRFAFRVWGKLDYLTPAYGSPGLYNFNVYNYQKPVVNNLDSMAGRVGFRFDFQASHKDQFTLQGDIFERGRHDEMAFPVNQPTVDLEQGHTGYRGGYVQAAWTRTTSPGNEGTLQFSYDKSQLDYPYWGSDLNNLTVDYQKRRQTGEHNEIYWGAGYQQYWDGTRSSRYIGFSPAGATYRMANVVIRDEWQIVPGRLMASAGVRVDYSQHAHWNYQPSFRAIYTPSARQSAWLALSRAVRIPSRTDRDLTFEEGGVNVGGIPVFVSAFGSPASAAETARSVEAGYRFQSGQRWSVDASLFTTYYQGLRAGSAPGMPQIVIQSGTLLFLQHFTGASVGSGRSYGGEIWGTWRVRRAWRLAPSYSYDRDSRWLPPSDATTMYIYDRQPSDLRHQATLRSEHDLSRDWQLDLMARARSRDLKYGTLGVLLVDARLGWRPFRSGEMSFSVRNLMDRRVYESFPELANAALPVRRTFLVKWTERF